MTGNVYINATGTLGGNGSGSNAINPIDCSTQVLYDAFLQNNAYQGSEQPTTRINVIYSAGTFKTNGSNFNLWWTQSHSGQTHQGAGIDVTFLQLVNAAGGNTGTIWGTGGASRTPYNFNLFDMTLDCNPAGNPKSGDCYDPDSGPPTGFPTGFVTVVDRGVWAGGTAYNVNDRVTGSDGVFYICFAANTGINPVTESPHLKWGRDGRGILGCINLASAVNVTIQRVKMIGWGTFLAGIECFVCYIGGTGWSSAQQVTNVLVDSCIFTSPGANNKDGCTVLNIQDAGPTGNLTCDETVIVSNCKWINCYSATPGQSGDFAYQHCVGFAPTVVNCTATNANIFYWAEILYPVLLQINTVKITGNTLTGVQGAMSILIDPTSPASFPNIIFANNFCCEDDILGFGNIAWTKTSGSNLVTLGNVYLTGNVFKSSLTNPSGITKNVLSMSGNTFNYTIKSLTCSNNLLINYPNNYVVDPIICPVSDVSSTRLGPGDRAVRTVQSPIAHTTAGSVTTQAVTLATTVTGNTLIAVINNLQAGAFTTVTGVAASAGTSVFKKAISQGEGTRNSEIWYAPNIISGTTPVVTATFSGTTTNCEVQIYEVQGLDPGGALEGVSFNWATSGASVVGSGILAANNPLDFFVVASYGGTTPSALSPGWNSNTSTLNGVIQNYIPGVTGNVQATATYANTDFTMVIAGFVASR